MNARKAYYLFIAAGIILSSVMAMKNSSCAHVPQDRLIQLKSRDDWTSGSFAGTMLTAEGIVLKEEAREGSCTSPPLSCPFVIGEIIPSWNIQTPAGCGSRVEIRLSSTGEVWSPWLCAGNWGKTGKAPAVASSEWGKVNIDYLTMKRPVSFIQARITLFSGRPGESPRLTLFSLACSSERGDCAIPLRRPLTAPFVPEPVSLNVPYRSQGDEDSSIAGDICSPTSVSMVMEYRGVKQPTASMAKLIYDPGHKLYGMWWRAVQGASQFGLTGWVQYFRNWEEVYRQISAGNPVIACISFGENELSSSPTVSSEGHVIVIRGFDIHGRVICNDPAGKDRNNGVTAYDREELARAWFDKGGVGYIILGPGAGSY